MPNLKLFLTLDELHQAIHLDTDGGCHRFNMYQTPFIRKQLINAIKDTFMQTEHVLINFSMLEMTYKTFTIDIISICKRCLEPKRFTKTISFNDLNTLLEILNNGLGPCSHCDMSGRIRIRTSEGFFTIVGVHKFVKAISTRHNIRVMRCNADICASNGKSSNYTVDNNISGVITVLCPKCFSQNRMNFIRFLRLASEGFNETSESWTCLPHTKLYEDPYLVGEIPKAKVSPYEHTCKNGHVYYESDRAAYDRCYICEAFENVTFFKMLDELKVNYDVKGVLVPGVSKKCNKVKLKKIIIITKNDKGHLTGKIVFADPYYSEELKADHNKLVFAAIEDYTMLDDRQWCLNFFGTFFKAINDRNNLT